MKKPLLWLLIAGSLAAGGYYASVKWPEQFFFWRTSATPETQRPGRPTTALVGTRDISFAITAAGEITPAEQVSVRPEISGRVDQLPVDIGDHVKKGELLFA